MNRVDIRDGIIAQLVNNWGDTQVALAYANAEVVNLAVVDRYIETTVIFGVTDQIDLGTNPSSRIHGTIEFKVCTKTTTGQNDALRMIDALSDIFQFKYISGVQISGCDAGHPVPVNGWYETLVYFNFYADAIK